MSSTSTPSVNNTPIVSNTALTSAEVIANAVSTTAVSGGRVPEQVLHDIGSIPRHFNNISMSTLASTSFSGITDEELAKMMKEPSTDMEMGEETQLTSTDFDDLAVADNDGTIGTQ